MRTSRLLSSRASHSSFHTRAFWNRPSSARNALGLRRSCRMALLCALGACALPSLAHAQEVRKVPVLSALPYVGKLFIPRQDAPISVPGKSLLVNIDAKSVPFGQLVEMLMDQAHVSYTLDAKLTALPTGNVKLRKVPFDIALQTILKMTSFKAAYILENSIYRIVTLEEAEAEKQAGAPPPSVLVPDGLAPFKVRMIDPEIPGHTSIEDMRVDLDANKIDLYTILKQMFTQGHANYTLDPSLQSYPVIANFKNAPFRVALNLLLKGSSKPLTYKVENGVYSIIPKEEPVPVDPKP